jgi:class 3 adenylate cyclase/DNA-binding winged helix-turn-helix (wHTH) protein/tetratricopeptide (TPR) repeat protein
MIYTFGEYELDVQLFELRHAGTPLQIEPKVFDLLVYVMRHRDRVVSKHELLEQLWPGQFISDATFDHCMMEARKAVGDSGRTQRVIKTVRGRGYRFVARLAEGVPAEQDVEEATATAAQQPAAGPGAASIICAQCQHDNASRARFCTECGAPLQVVCTQCQHSNTPQSKFCSACGAALAANALVQARDSNAAPVVYTPRHLAEQILTTRSALEGERKQVTVLFCDLPDSVGLARRLGPERMHGLLNRFFELALHAVHRYGGTVNQFLGDGLMALFGAPLAHEDHARLGVLAAQELHDNLRQHQEDFRYLQGQLQREASDLQVRMGLHTGTVVVGSIGDNLRMDYTAVGDTTNLAARFQQLADPGTILVSETTAKLVQDEVLLDPLGPVYVKGISEPVPVYKVVGWGPRRSALAMRLARILSRFVGRERELRTLHELLAQVKRGQGMVVGIVADPGMGKSRLLYEFLQSLAEQDVAYLAGHCVSYGSMMPYLPVLDMLRQQCGIAEGDSPEVVLAHVRQHVHQNGLIADEEFAYVLQLLGVKEGTDHLALLGSETVKSRTVEALWHLLRSRSKQQPLLLVVEDLHWVDQSSQDFFTMLAENLSGSAILLLATYRPGYQPPWIGKSYVTQMTLPRLAASDSLDVVYSVLQQETLPQALAQIILDKADGNPLFLEELTRVIVEHGGMPADAAVPDTIQGVLMARIDRLPDAAKRLLQTAAVLGRTFAARLVQAIWEEPEDLERCLGELKRLEFLYEENRAEGPVYVFRHALTQEVAYDSLLLRRRQRLHAAAGQALEHFYAERLEDAYDHLAYHYSKAEDTAKAVMYLRRFADKAAREHAHVEAVLALQGALAHSERLPADREHMRLRLDLHWQLALSLSALGRYQETLERLHQQQDQLAQLEDAALAGRYALLQSQTASYLGDWPQAAQSAEQAVAAAGQVHDDLTLGQAYHVLAMERYWTGQPAQGIDCSQRAIAALGDIGEDYRLGMAHFVLALNAHSLGRFDYAVEAAARAGAIGEALSDRRLQTFAAWTTGWVEATRGAWDAGIMACQRALEISSDPLNTAFALGWSGYAYLERGDAPAAIPRLEQARQHLHQFGYRRLEGLYITFLGEAHLLCGHLDTARHLVHQGLEIAGETPYRTGTAWAQRALGRMAQADGDLAVAARWLREALSTFTAMQADFEVGRTHLILAELAQQQDNRAEIILHLSEAHHLFTTLGVPVYVERTTQYASTLGLAFAAPATP